MLGLNLGPGPLPSSAQHWQERLRGAVAGLLADDDAAALLAHVRIAVVPSGADLQQVRVDLTGLQLTEDHRSIDLGGIDLTAVPRVGPAQPVHLRRLEVLADPAVVEAVPVRAHLVAEALPMFVARDGRDDLWALVDTRHAAGEARGAGTVEVPLAEAVARAKSLAAAELARHGLTLTSLDVQVRTPGRREVVLQAQARVRKGLLSASAQIRLDARLDDRMRAHIGQVQARSGNPVVALVLATMRRSLERYAGTVIDLNGYLPTGLHLRDLQVHADDHLRIQAELG